MFQKKTIIILSAIIGVVVLGAIAIVLVEQKLRPTNPASTDNSRISQDSEPKNNGSVNVLTEEITKPVSSPKYPLLLTTDIDTLDWQVYQDEEYGFEFGYPVNYKRFTSYHLELCGQEKCIEYSNSDGDDLAVVVNSKDDEYYQRILTRNERLDYTAYKTTFVNETGVELIYIYIPQNQCGRFLLKSGDANFVVSARCGYPYDDHRNANNNEILKALMTTWKFF